MKRIYRLTVTVLIVIALSLSAGMLFGCNKNGKKGDDTQLRAQTAQSIVDTILSQTDSSWKGDLTDAQLASVSNAGDYIVSREWAIFAADVLKNCKSLQTAKLQRLLSALESEQGAELLENFTENAENLIPLFKEVGFTPVDISTLLYDGLISLINNCGSVLDACALRLQNVKTLADGQSPQIINNLNVNIVNIRQSKDSYNNLSASGDEFIAAIDEAKAGLDAIISFAYRLSITSINDQLFDKLSSGALTNITDTEIITYINSMTASASELKSALTASQTAALDKALKLVLESFDDIISSSELLTQVIEYVRYAYIGVDYLPLICDVLNSAGSAVNSEFISKLRYYMENKDTLPKENKGILIASVLDKVFTDFGRKELLDAIGKLNSGTSGYQKNISLLYANVMLNMNVYNQNDTLSDFQLGDDYALVVMTILSESNLIKFKTEWYKYSADNTVGTTALYNAASVLMKYSSLTSIPHAAFTKNWYEYILNATIDSLNSTVEYLKPLVIDDIKYTIDYIFTDRTETEKSKTALLAELGKMDFVTDIDSVEYEKLQRLYYELNFWRMDNEH